MEQVRWYFSVMWKPSLLVIILFTFLSVDLISFLFFSGYELSRFAQFYVPSFIYSRDIDDSALLIISTTTPPISTITTVTTSTIAFAQADVKEDLVPKEGKTSPRSEVKEDTALKEVYQKEGTKGDKTVAMINVHLSKEDGKKWQKTTIEDNCVGLYTFMLTYTSHKIDLFFFHNHEGPLSCRIIKTFENTNVHWIRITNQWFNDAVEDRLRINATKYWGKKGGNVNTLICDFKPLYGIIFSSYVKEYQFYGYGDIDGLFGRTDLFTDLYQKYDMISGYCNTNNDQVYPTYHQCGRGYASGPLTFMRNNEATTTFLHTAIDKWWRKYFKVPKKFFLDEDFAAQPKKHFHTLHTILRDGTIDNNFRQYCHDSCAATNRSNELFIFNLNHAFTDSANVTYRWSKKSGITITANQTNKFNETVTTIFRPHFLHWSLWKYTGQWKIRRLRRQIYAKIAKVDCLEFQSRDRHGNLLRGNLTTCFE